MEHFTFDMRHWSAELELSWSKQVIKFKEAQMANEHMKDAWYH